MKIIHCADLHLESKMESNLDREKAMLRRSELLDTFERMIAYADENDVRAILIAGDMFDKPNIRKTAVGRVMEQIRSHPGIDFLYLRGNHDCGDFDALTIEADAPENLHLFSEDAWTSYDYGDVVVTGREISDENYRNLTVDLVLDPSRCNIVMLHGQESDYEGTDKTHTIHLEKLRGKFIDYLALGHIHSYKKDRLDENGEYCYAGCLEGRGFDECGQKGFVLLDIEEGKIASSFVPFAGRTLHELTVTVEAGMGMLALLDKVKQAADAIPGQDLIRVILTGYTTMDQDIDVRRITAALEPKFFFVRVYDRTQVEIDYESFANDRTLKGAFVRLLQEQELSEERRADIIEVGIRAIMGEEIDA